METKLATRPLPWVQENHLPHEKLFTQSLAAANAGRSEFQLEVASNPSQQ
jgi:hypothetical protein